MRSAIAIVVVAAAIAAVAPPAPAASNHAPGAPTNLRVDDEREPLAVTDDPAFSWFANDVDRNDVVRSYEIVVSSSADGSHVVLDTGRVERAPKVHNHVPGLQALLRPDHSYWWSVRTWDSARAGPYAPRARFDTGLADADWAASWIRRPGAEQSPIEDYSLVRKEVRIGASPVTRARVYASAGHHFELRVNGARLAIGPSYAYPDEQYYDAADVTAAVKAGAPNAFAFVAWWGQPGQGRPASVPAFIAHITIDHADGTRDVFSTDASWRTHTGPWVQDAPRNDEGDFVEHVDERLDPVGWDRPGFDDRSWRPAAVLGPHPAKPFTHLIAERTHIVEARTHPVSLHQVGNTWVADFGAVIAATPVVQVHHGTTGARVTLVGGYLLDADGRVSRTNGIQETNMTWNFDERAGAQELRPFGYLAFRYLEVDGADEPLTTDDVQIDARHASFPDENAATFTSSNPTLNAVWDLARHSALYDSQEQFLDTPTREKGPFLGDSFDVSQATTAAFGERSLTFQALRDFARSQQRYWPDGRVNVVYPNGDGKRDIPDGTEVYPLWAAYYTDLFDDRDLSTQFYLTARNIADYVARAIDPNTGLVTNLPGGGSDYLYGAVDWPPQMRYGYDMQTTARTTVNALAVADFAAVAHIAKTLGLEGEEGRETGRATDLARAMQRKLTRPDGTFVDGLHADGSQSTHASQQANAFALALGAAPRGSWDAIGAYVASLGTATGVVNFRFLLDALHLSGRDQALIDTLTDPKRPGYAQILAKGGTFTWESWDADRTGDSQSHGWGSTVLAVLQQDILGVTNHRGGTPFSSYDVFQGGFQNVVEVPRTNLTHAAGRVVTGRGPVDVSWTREPASGHETIDLTLPDDSYAIVRIHAPDAAHVNIDGFSVAHTPEVHESEESGGIFTVVIGSGHYRFENTPPTKSSSSSSTTTLALAIGFGALLLAGIGIGMWLAIRRRDRRERETEDHS